MMAVLTHIAAFVAGLIVAAAVASNCVRKRQTDADDVRPLVPAAPHSLEDAVRRAGC